MNFIQNKINKINKLFKGTDEESIQSNVDFAERTLFINKIMGKEWNEEQEVYFGKLASEYEFRHNRLINLLKLRESNNKEFLRKIKLDSYKNDVLCFIKLSEIKGDSVEDFLLDAKEKDIQKKAKHPEDYLFESLYSNDEYKNLTQVFSNDYTEFNNELNGYKNLNLSSNKKNQRNESIVKMLEEVFKIDKKDLLSLKGISLIVNPGMYFGIKAIKMIADTKTFKMYKAKVMGRIKDTLDKSETHQAFLENSMWINHLKRNKGKYIFVGLAASSILFSGAYADEIKELVLSVAELNTFDTGNVISNDSLEPGIQGETPETPETVDKGVVLKDDGVEVDNTVTSNFETPKLGDEYLIPSNGKGLEYIASLTLGNDATFEEVQKFVNLTVELNSIENKNLIYAGNTLQLPSLEQMKAIFPNLIEDKELNTQVKKIKFNG